MLPVNRWRILYSSNEFQYFPLYLKCLATGQRYWGWVRVCFGNSKQDFNCMIPIDCQHLQQHGFMASALRELVILTSTLSMLEQQVWNVGWIWPLAFCRRDRWVIKSEAGNSHLPQRRLLAPSEREECNSLCWGCVPVSLFDKDVSVHFVWQGLGCFLWKTSCKETQESNISLHFVLVCT